MRTLLTLALLGCLSGCGEPPTTAPAPPVDMGEALTELGTVYRYLAAQKIAPPRQVNDLAEYSGSLPGAWPLLQSGDIVVFWGSGFATGSNQILAHEKAAPAGGGKVLLRDGTVKTLTADEFKAAPKAK